MGEFAAAAQVHIWPGRWLKRGWMDREHMVPTVTFLTAKERTVLCVLQIYKFGLKYCFGR